jgi:hypothetical protein
MIRVRNKYDLLEEIPVEETLDEHLGKCKTLSYIRTNLEIVYISTLKTPVFEIASVLKYIRVEIYSC